MRRAMRHAQILGARDPLMWRLVPALTREMGQAYPELVRAEALIAETLKLEETRFRTTLARGLAILEDETRALAGRRRALRRDRLQALRHLRLPARPHAGRAARPRALRSTSTASTRRWSASAPRRAAPGRARARRRPRRSGTRLRERVGATEFLGYETETAEGVIARDRQGRRRGRAAGGRREGLAHPQPDAVLRRVRAARSATSARSSGPGFRAVVSDTRKKLGDLVVARRRDRRGRRARRPGGRTRGRPRRALGDPRQPFRDPHPARGAAARARRPCRAEGLARLARAAALRLRPSEGDHARRARRGRGHRQPRRARERRGRRRGS